MSSRIQFVEAVEITPVSFDRVMKLRNGRRAVITGDVGGIVAQLVEIDERINVWYQPEVGVYVLELHTPLPDGSIEESMIGAYEELDGRLVERVRQVCSPDYNIGAEIEASEARAAKANDEAHHEKAGDLAERLQHALRKDLSRHETHTTLKARAFIPRAFHA